MTPRRRAAATIALAMAIVAAQELSRRALVSAMGEARPPQRLSETGIEQGRPFSPQYPLWSDGAVKRRWVSFPAGAAVDVSDVNAWNFPVGTRFFKEFAFGGRKVETRLLWKASPARWVFASYAWNEAQTEAYLAPDEGIPGVAEIGSGKRHSIPSVADCRACHDTKRTQILGFNALQLSTDRDPNAIHGEPLQPGMLTLQTLVDEGQLRPARPELLAAPPRIATSSPRTRAVLGYMSTNCGGCHNRDGDIAMLGPSLKPGDIMEDGDAAARSMIGHVTTWQVPGVPEGSGVLIDPAAPERSAILTRMRSRRPSSQMPPIGTVVADRQAMDAIGTWIRTELAAAIP